MTPAKLAQAITGALDPLKLDCLSQFTVEGVTHLHREKTTTGSEVVAVLIDRQWFNITITKARRA